MYLHVRTPPQPHLHHMPLIPRPWQVAVAKDIARWWDAGPDNVVAVETSPAGSGKSVICLLLAARSRWTSVVWLTLWPEKVRWFLAHPDLASSLERCPGAGIRVVQYGLEAVGELFPLGPEHASPPITGDANRVLVILDDVKQLADREFVARESAVAVVDAVRSAQGRSRAIMLLGDRVGRDSILYVTRLWCGAALDFSAPLRPGAIPDASSQAALEDRGVTHVQRLIQESAAACAEPSLALVEQLQAVPEHQSLTAAVLYEALHRLNRPDAGGFSAVVALFPTMERVWDAWINVPARMRRAVVVGDCPSAFADFRVQADGLRLVCMLTTATQLQSCSCGIGDETGSAPRLVVAPLKYRPCLLDLLRSTLHHTGAVSPCRVLYVFGGAADGRAVCVDAPECATSPGVRVALAPRTPGPTVVACGKRRGAPAVVPPALRWIPRVGTLGLPPHLTQADVLRDLICSSKHVLMDGTASMSALTAAVHAATGMDIRRWPRATYHPPPTPVVAWAFRVLYQCMVSGEGAARAPDACPDLWNLREHGPEWWMTDSRCNTAQDAARMARILWPEWQHPADTPGGTRRTIFLARLGVYDGDASLASRASQPLKSASSGDRGRSCHLRPFDIVHWLVKVSLQDAPEVARISSALAHSNLLPNRFRVVIGAFADQVACKPAITCTCVGEGGLHRRCLARLWSVLRAVTVLELIAPPVPTSTQDGQRTWSPTDFYRRHVMDVDAVCATGTEMDLALNIHRFMMVFRVASVFAVRMRHAAVLASALATHTRQVVQKIGAHFWEYCCLLGRMTGEDTPRFPELRDADLPQTYTRDSASTLLACARLALDRTPPASSAHSECMTGMLALISKLVVLVQELHCSRGTA